MYNRLRSMKNAEVRLLLRRVVSAVTLVSLVPALISLVSMGVVPSRYLWVALPLYVALTLGVVALATRPKLRWKGVIPASVIMAMLLIAVNVSMHLTAQATTTFLSSLQQPKTSYVEYSLIAKKDKKVTLATARTVGMITTDNTYREAVAAMASETSARPAEHRHLTSVMQALTSGTTDLAAIRTANLALVEENAPKMHKNIVVLGTFKVKTTQDQTSDIDTTKPFVAYVSGMDAYGDIDDVSRSDVNMLLVVNPVERKLLLVNTPRDYYVQLHGTTGRRDKLTHAGVYGVDMSRQTLADLYEVDIPFHLRLNFTSLVKVVDTIGPVRVYSAHDFKSFQKGYNTLSSAKALEFARERYSFQSGDRERGRNQQRVIEAIVAKLSEPQNIVRYNAILAKLQGSLQTNMSSEAITKLANMQLDDMKRWSVKSISVDGRGAMQQTYSMGDMPLYVMMPDEKTVQTARSQIRAYLQ